MGLLRTAGRAAVASSVHGRVQRRQQQRWAAPSQAQPVAPAQQPAAQPAPAQPAPSAPISTDEMLVQLERLAKLRESGVLTDAEFAAQKARILG